MRYIILIAALAAFGFAGCGGSGQQKTTLTDTRDGGSVDTGQGAGGEASDPAGHSEGGTEDVPPAAPGLFYGDEDEDYGHGARGLPGIHDRPVAIDPDLPPPFPQPSPPHGRPDTDPIFDANSFDNHDTGASLPVPDPQPRPGGLSESLRGGTKYADDGMQTDPKPCAETPDQFYNDRRWCR